MNLYEISQRYQNLIELLEDETIPQEEINKALEVVASDVADKCENGIAYMAMLKNTIKTAKEEKARIDSYIKMLESRTERLEEAYVNFFKMLDKKAIVTAKGEMKIRLSPPALVIDDATKIPAEFEKTEIKISYDKMAIKKALKEGRQIEGCHIEQAEKLKY